MPLALGAPLRAERPYDGEAGRIIDEAHRQLDDFTDEMTSGAPGSEVSYGDGVSSDIPDFVATLKAAARDLKERFDYKDAASDAALLFLQRAKVAERFVERHPFLARPDGEWAKYLPRLRALAGVYHVDWDAEPETWRASRWTDLELGRKIDVLDRELRALGKGLDGAAKAAGQETASRQILRSGVEGVRSVAKSLGKKFGDGQPVGGLVPELFEGARALAATAEGLGLGAAAPEERKVLARSLDELARAFGTASGDSVSEAVDQGAGRESP